MLVRKDWQGLRKGEKMATFLHILFIVVCVLLALFLLSLLVYFFNLDMKVSAQMEKIMHKHYDRIKRDRRL